MLESAEDIEFALDTAGEILQFCCGTNRAIPGSDMYLVQNVANDIEVQQIVFISSEKEIKNMGIKEKDLFTYSHPNLKTVYQLKVSGFLFDFTGWGQIYASYQGVQNV